METAAILALIELAAKLYPIAVNAFQAMKASGALTPEQIAKIEASLAESSAALDALIAEAKQREGESV
jgi:hypothetical protein